MFCKWTILAFKSKLNAVICNINTAFKDFEKSKVARRIGAYK